VARCDVPHRDLLPFSTEFSIRALGATPEIASVEINKVMNSLELTWIWKPNILAGLAITKENVWSRSARRKKTRQIERAMSDSHEMEIDNRSNEIDDEAIALAVKIGITPDWIVIRWLQGSDCILFESFCGMLKRHLANSK
jgi:23S rRNA (adenine1618-N6)-methyltransferase